MTSNQLFELLTGGRKGFVLRNSIIFSGLLLFQLLQNLGYGLGVFNPDGYIRVSIIYLWILTHNKILVDKFYAKKRRGVYILLLLLGMSLYISLLTLYQYLRFPPKFFNIRIIYSYLFNIIADTGFGAACYYSFKFFLRKKEFYQLNELKRQVELDSLKTQLHPHFLFNSLNNIYSYNLENRSYGNDLILKLSLLMRYIVESTRLEKVTLTAEVEFISNYISFERERLQQRCDVRFASSGEFDNFSIEPLLFFPLVENAFKHGASTISKSFVHVDIKVKESELLVSIENGILNNNSSNSTYVGLSNVQRRLALLYPGKHELKVESLNEKYITRLIIQLK